MFENIVLWLVGIWLVAGLWLTVTALQRPERP
jgi:hypothetical protein